MYKNQTIIGSSVDVLVRNGVKHIKTSGREVTTHVGYAFQADNVSYVLTNCYNGFFSVITELLASLLSENLKREIKPGYIAMHSNFTQIYQKTAILTEEILAAKEILNLQKMPRIVNGFEVLDDIYRLGKYKPKSEFIEWSIKNAK